MKTIISKLGPFFLPSLLILSGCSDSNLRTSNLSGAIGLADSEVPSSISLSEEEVRLAKDPSYISIQTSYDATPVVFNREAWPKADDKGVSQNLRDITISGQILIVDENEYPWSVLKSTSGIRSLRLEADKIVIRSRIYLPSANVRIVADEVLVSENGAIDITPADSGDIQAPFGKDMKNKDLPKGGKDIVSYNGADGVHAGTIQVLAPRLKIYGDSAKARFVAKGGAGEAAGQGRGYLENEKRGRAAGKTKVGNCSTRRDWNQFSESIIFCGAHVFGFKDGLYRDIGEGGSSMVPEWTDDVGSSQWPEDGLDAIAGGYPGAGGNGGHVVIVTNDNVSDTTVDITVGRDGKTDGKRYGSLAGLPNPAYQIHWTHRRNNISVPNLVSHTQVDGKSAEAPSAPRSKNADGSFEVQSFNSSSKDVLSKAYFDLKLKRIKERYFARDFNETIRLLNQVDEKLGNIRNSEFMVYKIQVTRLTEMIANQKDYFGRNLRDVPLYSFNFAGQAYEEQVKQMARSYYLSRVFDKHFVDETSQVAAVKAALDDLEKKLIAKTKDLQESFVILNNLTTEIYQVEKNEKSIQAELAEIRKQIEREAQRNVNARKSKAEFFKIVDTAAAICQVIPVYQPALGAVATLVRTAVKGPKDQSLAGYVDWFREYRGQIEGIEGNADFAKSKENWEQFKDKFDMRNLENKTLVERVDYISDLYKEMNPAVQKISEQIRSLNQPVFGEEELQAEIAKIQADDPVFGPLFQDIQRKLTDLLQRKAKIQADTLAFTEIVENTFVDMSNYVAISAKLSDQSLQKGMMDDGVLKRVFASMQQENENELLRAYSDLVTTYEYLTLEKYPRALSVMYLRDRMNRSLKEEGEKTAAEILSAFYLSEKEQIEKELQEKVRQGDPRVNTRAGALERPLSKEEIRLLNKNGYVDIALDQRLFANYENVRINKVAIAPRYSKFERVSSEIPNQTSIVTVDLSLAREGKLHYKNVDYRFTYPDGEKIFAWRHQFRFQPGSDQFTDDAGEVSENFKGLIEKIFNIQGNHQLTTLFEARAGVTTVRVSRTSIGGYKIKDMALKVNYIYSL